jgi:anaerobic magnesium-protoporphyrin IX monomethyl ester cyclase
MKVLLVKPPSTMHLVTPPLSLGYLAALIRDRVEVRILDCLMEKIGVAEFGRRLAAWQPDVVGLTAFTVEIEAALQCARAAKQWNPAVITVIGGPHASNAPEMVLRDDHVDYIFQGEAEIGFPLFIDQLRAGHVQPESVPGLGFKRGAPGQLSFTVNPPQFVQDLDQIPFPDHELMQVERYPRLYLARRTPSIPIFTSRGCPYFCTFCAGHRISGRQFRTRSAANIMAEIDLLRERYGVREIQIWDDIFTLDRERVLAFCDMVIARRWDLNWWCPNGVRLETLDYEMLKKMKASGCYAIVLGIEAGAERIQKLMKKNLNFRKLREVTAMAKQLGIRTQGFFILGYPGETRAEILQTIALAVSLPLDRASFSMFQPLFGSEIYADLERQGALPTLDFSTIEYSKPTMVSGDIGSLKELKNLQRRALLRFYLRPRVFARFVWENLSWHQLKSIQQLVKKYVFNR